ncbi:CDP-diacylglycerol--glycerol-3-phosphate 3-phosphatidyltransferase [Candidatus Woesearchaeota archaeon]|nr:CDP-diacylglycerol--glycerol-3-phosphate 3-phosphatidyltransferase [Candidatus Woesearchaeota archaeon]
MKRLLYKSNQITLLRVLLIPVFLLFLSSNLPYKEYISAFIFIILALSDALDGYIARKRKEVTELGKIIDPISDKLLIGAALIFLIGRGVDAWMAIAILGREIIITAIRLIALARGIVISASMLGKAKTISQILAIILVILNIPGSWYFMLVAVIITLVSGVDYAIKAAMTIEEKIINIPNMITTGRLFLMPLYLIMLFRGLTEKALLIFIVIGLTDKLDGLFARITKQKTTFGKIFDSFTDWTVILVSFIVFYILGFLEFYWIVLMLIPSVVNSIIKLFYLKKEKDVILAPIAQIAVGFTYLTVAAVLINFIYKYYFLIAMLIFVYLAMFRYLYLFLKKSENFKIC